MLIKFEEREGVGICTTPCPHGYALEHSVIMVNSHTCTRCNYFDGHSEDGEAVRCLNELS